MSFIGSSLSGSSGAGFQAQSAPIASPTTVAQANQTYDQSQNAIQQQQAFLQALQAQNGIQNQSNVYSQLQGVANGTGPNPAQAMLANATGANNATQASLMAGQRGAGANTGLIARQAAQQGATNQQNAVGQGAALQANQSLNALGQLSGIAGQQVGQQAAATGALTGATQGEQGLILGGIQGQNQANVANISQQNSANAGIAAGNQKFQQGLIGGAGQALMAKGGPVMRPGYSNGEYVDASNSPPPVYAPSVQAPAAPAVAPVNPKTSGPKSNVGQFLSNQTSSQDPNMSAGNQAGSVLGTGIRSIFKKSQPTGSPNAPAYLTANTPDAPDLDAEHQPGISSGIEGSLASSPLLAGADSAMPMAADGGDVGSMKALLPMALMALAKGGRVPALVSPGERYLPPKEVEKVAKGKDPLKAGEKIPGKAKVKGNSYKNDTVPKTLEEGGIVLPKSIMESKHPHWEAHKFVSAILAKQGLKKGLKK